MVIKVKNKNEIEGVVTVEHWANPEIFLMDFQIENGDFWPEYREDLKFISVEEF